MHRIDTPTAQIDKFGPGKNGFTNGDPATGRRATDLNSDMWDAVQEEMANAIEGNGIALDKSKHNQLYLAIQKAITEPGFLKKANNLSDVANVPEARGNLGLGTAATKNVGSDEQGQVLTVGNYGLSNTLVALNNADLNTIQTFGFYVVQKPINGPAGSETGTVFLQVRTWQSGAGVSGYRVAQELVGYGVGADKGNRVWRRTWNGSVWGGWFEFYTEAHKPTAADVNAYTKQEADGQFIRKTGDDYTGALKARGNGSNSNGEVRSPSGVFLPYADDGMRAEVYGVDVVGDHFEYRIVIVKNGVGVHYFSFRDDGRLSLPGEVNTPGNITAWDLKANGGVYDGGARVYSRNNPPSTANLAPNGWHRDNVTGVIKQWGRADASGGERHVFFPTAFPSACYSIQITVGTSNNITASYFNDTTTGFDFALNGGSGAYSLSWEATGK